MRHSATSDILNVSFIDPLEEVANAKDTNILFGSVVSFDSLSRPDDKQDPLLGVETSTSMIFY